MITTTSAPWESVPELVSVYMVESPNVSFNGNYRTSVNLTMTTPSPALPVIPTADFPAQIDRDRLQAAMANSRVSSTGRCYASQWKLWSAWARDRDLEEIPAAPAAVANFLVDRADAGTSIATVPDGPSCARSHTPGLRAHRPHRQRGCPSCHGWALQNHCQASKAGSGANP